MRFALTALATLIAVSATALDVVFDERSPKENCEWVDKSHVREQMVAVAEKICKVLYGGTKNENIGDDFTITLYPTPEKKGNPGFASGRRVTWRVGTNPDYDASNGIGLLAHEMTHVLDLNARPMAKSRFAKFFDGKFVEATAVWVTDYNVKYGYKGYWRCTSPEILLDRRYEALRYRREWGGYRAGAGFFDFVEQTYGKGTALKLIWEQTATGKQPWERVLGKTMEELEAEWRQMETIYDPVFQWNYNGTAAGAVRKDKKFCGLKTISAVDSPDKAGAWLDGATASKVEGVADGSLTIALHGRFPKKDNVAIASLGAAKEGNGKALLLAASSKANALAAHVIASVPGKGCHIVSTTPIPLPPTPTKNSNSSPVPRSPFPVPRSPFPVPHSLILSVKDGDEATVIVDGKPVAKIDMKAKCKDCAFAPVFAVGGMSGGFGVAGFSEPRGADGVLLDDMRVFTRAFRAKESASYAATFGPDYRGAVPVEGTWIGPQGGTDLDNPANWKCFNSYGEKIVAVPTKDTDVTVWCKTIPSIPPKSTFACKSFTIDGIAVVDEANVDLRGVGTVEFSGNTKIITSGGRMLAVSKMRGDCVRLHGKLAVTSAMKLSGKLELNGGCVLRLPENPSAASVGEIALSGEGNASIRPGVMPQKAKTCKVLRAEKLPEDLSRLSLYGADEPSAAEFRQSADNKTLVVYRRK